MLSHRYPVLQLETNTAIASSHVRLLGVDISFDLSLNHHVCCICATCYYQFLPHWCLRWSLATLVYTVVNSQDHYCNSVLAGAPRTVMDKLQHMSNAAASLHKSSPALRSLTAAWVIYCNTNVTSTTFPTVWFTSWQWLFTNVWMDVHCHTCWTTASKSLVLTLSGIGIPPTVCSTSLPT